MSSLVSLWMVFVPVMKQSRIIHTVALCWWGFAGSRVLCKNCFASFVARSMMFVMSSPLQPLLLFLGLMSHLFTFSSHTVPLSLLAFSSLLLHFSLLLSIIPVTHSLLAFSSLLLRFSLLLSILPVTHSLLAFSSLVQRLSLSSCHLTVTISLLAFSTFLLSFGAMFCNLRQSFLFPLGVLFFLWHCKPLFLLFLSSRTCQIPFTYKPLNLQCVCKFIIFHLPCHSLTILVKELYLLWKRSYYESICNGKLWRSFLRYHLWLHSGVTDRTGGITIGIFPPSWWE